MRAALDMTVDDRHVDLSLLIQDEQGTVSEQFSTAGSSGNEPDPEERKNTCGATLYHKIIGSDCEVIGGISIVSLSCESLHYLHTGAKGS